jgi:hypothetical protein
VKIGCLLRPALPFGDSNRYERRDSCNQDEDSIDYIGHLDDSREIATYLTVSEQRLRDYVDSLEALAKLQADALAAMTE